MKIIIEQHKKSENELKINPAIQWKVTVDVKYAENLTYEEMLGVLISLTMPTDRPCIHWLRTKEEHIANIALWGRKVSVATVVSSVPSPAEIKVLDVQTKEFNGSC